MTSMGVLHAVVVQYFVHAACPGKKNSKRKYSSFVASAKNKTSTYRHERRRPKTKPAGSDVEMAKR
ncbi:hypothetical protein VFPBJ_04948 [Purpureocillium lilacinum]|uniref:Uncharacterized protein n=1 Tax=Purpureocillium lilacinum TaxID=33203 RepID=A0A179GWT9_PURLI|nr:hypothetical protein VFPBJ_04948 [Purpureocillium lilacinum]